MTALGSTKAAAGQAVDQRAPWRGLFQLRRLSGRLITFEAFLAFTFIYVPILILIIFSFNASRFNAVWRGFTLDWYASLFQGAGVVGLGGISAREEFAAAGILHTLKNSLYVASIATVISTVLGTLAALGMERFRFKMRGWMDVMIYLPIIIPEITMGISLAVFFNLIFRYLNGVLDSVFPLALPDATTVVWLNSVLTLVVNFLNNTFDRTLNLSYWTIIIGHVSFNISFVAVVVRARLAGMDKTLEEAAQDCGANYWQTFRRIVLPLIMPGIVGGALLAFTLSLDDFVVTFYTAGIGTSTLPLFVYGMIRFEVTPAINAISTLMLAVSVVLVVFSLVLQRR